MGLNISKDTIWVSPSINLSFWVECSNTVIVVGLVYPIWKLISCAWLLICSIIGRSPCKGHHYDQLLSIGGFYRPLSSHNLFSIIHVWNISYILQSQNFVLKPPFFVIHSKVVNSVQVAVPVYSFWMRYFDTGLLCLLF